MTNSKTRQTTKRKINWRSIALPAEHGGWSLLLEPMILGLILAPTGAGLFFALAMSLVFLAHQPLKIILKAYHTGKFTDRSRLALNFAAGYLILGMIFAIPALLQANASFWLTIALIIPFALIQMRFDFANQSRSQTAELSGAIALSGAVSLLVLLSGWTLHVALLIWFVIALRAVTSILYVRAFFRKQRNQPVSIMSNHMIHGIALVVIITLALMKVIPYLTIVPFIILLFRAIHGLQSDKIVKPQIIGIREVIFGVITIAFIVIGYIYAI